jgi:hypothetical protein
MCRGRALPRRALATSVKDAAAGQAPFAAIVGRIDARVLLEPALDRGQGDAHDARLVQTVAEANAPLTAARLPPRGTILAAPVTSGDPRAAAAMHDMTSAA